jgi:hypothetical protein
MNNMSTGLKKFLSNKNTVTILGVLLMVVVIYIGYNWRVNIATNPIEVPYAINTISAGTEITADDVGTIEVPPAMLGDAIRDSQSVIGKYTMADTVIPAGSLFYSRAVCEEDQLPQSIILKYPKGYVLYYMPVNMETTYSNSIYPNNYIDVYLKADVKNVQGDTTSLIFGKLLENVKVLAVRDSNGKNVFSNVVEGESIPAQLIFAVPKEYYLLLKKAEYLADFDTQLLPVPTAESLKSKPGDLTLSSTDLQTFINDKTVYAK